MGLIEDLPDLTSVSHDICNLDRLGHLIISKIIELVIILKYQYALIRKAQVDAIVDDNGLESFEVKP